MKKILFIFGLLIIAQSCRYHYHLKNTEAHFVKIDTSISESGSKIDKIIAPYREKMEVEMSEVLAYNPIELTLHQPESSLGNWAADAIQYAGGKKTDFSVINYGGLRIPSLPAGPVKRSHLFELMPFDNALSILVLDSSSVALLFEVMEKKGGWPISKEARFNNNGNHKITIAGKALTNAKTYTVLISDYLANGGDNCDFLTKAPREDLSILLRDALIQYAAASDTLKASIDGRFRE